ncbi:MAG: Opacity protein [Hyphomicrobiales bacterium]|nr:Opacity protein [Hyphomicrobiales bacterium]
MQIIKTSTALSALLAVAAPFAASSGAQAADLPSRAAPVPSFIAAGPVANWEGFYAGTFIGGGHTKFTSSQIDSRSVSKTGQTGGPLAGFNFQTGAFVYGLEGDLGLHLIRTRNPGSAGLITHNVDTLYSAHLRGRLGYDLGAFLPFVAGGLAYNESYVSLPGLAGDRGAVKSRYGWTAGAGVDWKFDAPFFGQVILRGEYLYEGMPSATYTYDALQPSVRMKTGTHFLRAALITTLDPKGRRTPMDAMTVDWRGPYAGVIAGYGRARARTSDGIVTESLTSDGAMGGIYAGRNFAFGNLVVGFEGSTSLTDWEGSGTVPGTLNAQNYRNYIEADVRGRLGYSFGRFLPFVAGGVAWGRSEQIDRATGSQRGRIPTEAWTLGAGVDYMIADNLSARVEYQHQRTMKNVDVFLNGVILDQKRNADLFRVGVAYHFN